MEALEARRATIVALGPSEQAVQQPLERVGGKDGVYGPLVLTRDAQPVPRVLAAVEAAELGADRDVGVGRAACGAEDLRATTMYKDSAFIYAASSGMVGLLAEFIERGQDVNFVDDEGSTALHSSVVNEQLESVRALLTLGIDTTIKTREPVDEEDEPAQTAQANGCRSSGTTSAGTAL